MALYTHLSRKEISRLASGFGLPPPRSHSGILQGTVNTYYRLSHSDGSYYLKIDEVGDLKRLRRELTILHRLADAKRVGFLTPTPIPTTSGSPFARFRSRSVLLFPEIPGSPILSRPYRRGEIGQIGHALARLHHASGRKALPPHRFHLPELFRIYRQIGKKLRRKHPTVDLEIRQRLVWLDQHEPKRVPSGLIHADLFPENILFEKGQLRGIVDFEAAGWGPYLFDLATTINACCHGRKGFNIPLVRTFMAAYSAVRPLTKGERGRLEYFLYQSAVRFLLTRLRDFELKEGPVRAKPFKDYRIYLRRLTEIARLNP